MRQISSRFTFWHKRIFPIFWFGFWALWTCIVASWVVKSRGPVFILLVPVAIPLFGYLLMRRMIFPLADEVFLDGDDVIVRKDGMEARFPVRQIINVDSSIMANPARITLTLREPCELGREIIFSGSEDRKMIACRQMSPSFDVSLPVTPLSKRLPHFDFEH